MGQNFTKHCRHSETTQKGVDFQTIVENILKTTYVHERSLTRCKKQGELMEILEQEQRETRYCVHTVRNIKFVGGKRESNVRIGLAPSY